MVKYCWLLAVAFFSGISLYAQSPDRFAEIGNKIPATRTQLLKERIPGPLPDIHLPILEAWAKGFSPMDRLDTPEELKLVLKSFRKQYEPFLRQLAPVMEEKRERIILTNFNWREETPADQKDFPSVLSGKGEWKKVQVPHYGPPLGKATTYYQTDFVVSPSMIEKGAVFLSFKAVDYKAHVFVNGAYIGSHEGAFAPFEFEVTAYIKAGRNALLVKVENDYPMLGHVGEDGRKLDGDKVYAATGLGYDDPELGWHHCPPGMGIWQEVAVEARATLHVHDIFVRPIADSDTAEIWLEINNTLLDNKELTVRHSLYGQNFPATIYTGALYKPATVHVPGVGDLVKPTDWEKKELKMGKGMNFLKFRIIIPGSKRWHPDHPWLYQLQIELLDLNGRVVDAMKQHFGIRSFRMDTVSYPKGAMYLNGAFTRLRGANTMGAFMQSVIRKDWDQLVDDILLAKIANMNYIRMTQFPVQPEVYDYCDMLGMMTQSDLPLFGMLRRNKWAECIRQVEELERLVRSHPANIMVSYINERFPNGEGNPHRHFSEYEEFAGFFRAADEAVRLANPDRVIKAGDGDYDPPSPGLPDNHVYNGWYNGHGLGLGEMYKGYWLPVKPGWLYACGEFGSEGLDFYNTMREYYPKKWLPENAEAEKNWTPNVISMAQSYRFHYMWFNRQHSVKDWIRVSQDHQAKITRLTTESFRRNNDLVSFAIHLFIDAWPAGWMKSIMDVKRQPKPAYFEYAHALAPLAVSLRSDRRQFFSGDTIAVEAWIANDRNTVPQQATLRYQWEQNGKVLSVGQAPANILANRSRFQGYIQLVAPKTSKRMPLLLRLQLVYDKGLPVHETDFDAEVFPAPSKPTGKAWIAGNAKGVAHSIAEQLELSITEDMMEASVLLIDHLPAYHDLQGQIDSLVKQGKTAVVLQPGAGSFQIAGDSVTVSKTTMGQYYFVAPSLEHAAMKGFRPDDFKFWYNGNKGVFSPILGEMSVIKGWTSLAATGQTGWVGANDYANAAAEKKLGNGVFRINHVQLDGRVKYNPVARQFALELFNLQGKTNN
ncbi:hypothetical protein L0U88_03585 [Flavihumibacter sp. RY-1]|uniref:Beta-galactosidase n=1 Tax=Flavihumibacter fluminis TaxID=2909236 RepID=A0ABS9BGC4_9BACT|nr:sugar-binding domain-containing protein [Flavihumibacter fluminis]MCF1713711.1 hypothetical protein [Flavihumibacter fluminis]